MPVELYAFDVHNLTQMFLLFFKLLDSILRFPLKWRERLRYKALAEQFTRKPRARTFFGVSKYLRTTLEAKSAMPFKSSVVSVGRRT